MTRPVRPPCECVEDAGWSARCRTATRERPPLRPVRRHRRQADTAEAEALATHAGAARCAPAARAEAAEVPDPLPGRRDPVTAPADAPEILAGERVPSHGGTGLEPSVRVLRRSDFLAPQFAGAHLLASLQSAPPGRTQNRAPSRVPGAAALDSPDSRVPARSGRAERAVPAVPTRPLDLPDARRLAHLVVRDVPDADGRSAPQGGCVTRLCEERAR